MRERGRQWERMRGECVRKRQMEIEREREGKQDRGSDRRGSKRDKQRVCESV